MDKAPENGVNRSDMVIPDKINKNWIIIEGNVCLIGEITEREKLKSSKYRDLREAIEKALPRLYSITTEHCLRLSRWLEAKLD